MSQIPIKAGQILHAMNQFVVDRIQAAGPNNLNIPTERVYELGNYQTVAVVRDIPDLTFGLDALDVDTQIEAILTGSTTPNSDADGTAYRLSEAIAVDVISPWKSSTGNFDTVRGVVVPHLTLESASYRYGLRENAGENFSLRGDSIFYVPGTPYQETYTGDGVITAFGFANGPALIYRERGEDLFALNVSVDGERALRGSDYTETDGGIEFLTAPANGAVVRVAYASEVVGTFNQDVHGVPNALAIKPAAVRGKDIEVFVGGRGGAYRWGEVQSATVDYRVTIEDDFEFGNARAIAREFADVPAVTGTVEIQPLSIDRLFAKLEQITGATPGDVIGPESSATLPLEIRLHNPASGGTPDRPVGEVVKTLYVPDARFMLPGYEGRVQQKLVQTLNWESDTGVLEVYRGAPA